MSSTTPEPPTTPDEEFEPLVIHSELPLDQVTRAALEEAVKPRRILMVDHGHRPHISTALIGAALAEAARHCQAERVAIDVLFAAEEEVGVLTPTYLKRDPVPKLVKQHTKFKPGNFRQQRAQIRPPRRGGR